MTKIKALLVKRAVIFERYDSEGATMAAMKAGFAYACALLGVIAALNAPAKMAFAQDLASQLVGVWKRTGVVHKIQATGETTKPDGENPTGMFILSRGGHFVFILIADGRKPPASQPPTDAERVYLSKTGGAGGGTYKVNGDKVTLAYTDSTNQVFTGTERAQTAQVSGKVMTWTSAPFKNAEGKDVVAIFTYERLE